MKEKLQRINEVCNLKTEWGFTIKVKIVDYKNSYGRDRWLVTPMEGNGEAWVEGV